MGLSSFTNQVGTFVRYGYKNTVEEGYYYGSNQHATWSSASQVEYSYKPAIFPAFGRNSNYSRVVAKVTKDEPYTTRRYITEGNHPNEYVTVDLKTTAFISDGYQPWSYKLSDPGATNARDKSITLALNDLASKANAFGQSREGGLGSDAGQLRQTGEELARLCSQLANALLAAKRGDVFGFLAAFGLSPEAIARSRGRSIADLWLEYSYGIVPLLADIHDTNDIVRAQLLKGTLLKGHGRGKSENSLDFDAVYSGHQGHAHCTSKVSYHTTLFGTVRSSYAHKLNELGLFNPLVIAWDLFPWTFVIDWFVPVGNTLQALTAGFGLTDAAGYTSSQLWYTNNIRMVPNYFGGYGYGVVTSGNYDEAEFHFDRTCYASLPLPKLYANTAPYSTPRALNALALVRQLA